MLVDLFVYYLSSNCVYIWASFCIWPHSRQKIQTIDDSKYFKILQRLTFMKTFSPVRHFHLKLNTTSRDCVACTLCITAPCWRDKGFWIQPEGSQLVVIAVRVSIRSKAPTIWSILKHFEYTKKQYLTLTYGEGTKIPGMQGRFCFLEKTLAGWESLVHSLCHLGQADPPLAFSATIWFSYLFIICCNNIPAPPTPSKL